MEEVQEDLLSLCIHRWRYSQWATTTHEEAIRLFQNLIEWSILPHRPANLVLVSWASPITLSFDSVSFNSIHHDSCMVFSYPICNQSCQRFQCCCVQDKQRNTNSAWMNSPPPSPCFSRPSLPCWSSTTILDFVRFGYTVKDGDITTKGAVQHQQMVKGLLTLLLLHCGVQCPHYRIVQAHPCDAVLSTG